jgi:hypothetical protein
MYGVLYGHKHDSSNYWSELTGITGIVCGLVSTVIVDDITDDGQKKTAINDKMKVHNSDLESNNTDDTDDTDNTDDDIDDTDNVNIKITKKDSYPNIKVVDTSACLNYEAFKKKTFG